MFVLLVLLSPAVHPCGGLNISQCHPCGVLHSSQCHPCGGLNSSQCHYQVEPLGHINEIFNFHWDLLTMLVKVLSLIISLNTFSSVSQKCFHGSSQGLCKGFFKGHANGPASSPSAPSSSPSAPPSFPTSSTSLRPLKSLFGAFKSSFIKSSPEKFSPSCFFGRRNVNSP